MNEEIKSWHDFNNQVATVKLGGKKFVAKFYEINNKLILKVNLKNDIQLSNTLQKDLPYIKGILVFDNTELYLHNCMFKGIYYKGVYPNTKITIEYIVDRVLVGNNKISWTKKILKNYDIVLDNIDCLTFDKPYIMDKDMKYTDNLTNYLIENDSYSVNICFGCSVLHGDNCLHIDRETRVSFSHKNNINISKVIENIYTFRNFLMIILKRKIDVKSLNIIIDDKSYSIYYCNDYDKLENTEILEHLNHECLKIEQIENISQIYKNFCKNYKKLLPFLELYYNITNFKVPALTNFLNCTTMLEFYARTYEFSKSLKLTKSKNNKKTDPEYIDMVSLLISQVNSIYNFTNQEIDQIATNIKSARIYYTHYKTKQTSKKLTYDEQFSYSFFIQDIVLLNIYKLLKLDIDKYSNITFSDFYYEKNELI